MAPEPRTGTAPAPRGSATRHQILVAAERLVGERGIAALSLREAAGSAGARNNSAAQYHFGTKDGLIDAIFELRMGTINEARLARLDAADAEGRGHDVRALVEALVVPLVEAMGEAPQSSWYGRFLAEFTADPQATARLADVDRGVMTGLRRVIAGLQAYLHALPAPIRRQRIDLAIRMTILATAEYERRRDAGRLEVGSPAVLAAGLCDAVTGLLNAPVSASTARLLPHDSP
jgi:AcrR family transcriptional regulator